MTHKRGSFYVCFLLRALCTCKRFPTFFFDFFLVSTTNTTTICDTLNTMLYLLKYRQMIAMKNDSFCKDEPLECMGRLKKSYKILFTNNSKKTFLRRVFFTSVLVWESKSLNEERKGKDLWMALAFSWRKRSCQREVFFIRWRVFGWRTASFWDKKEIKAERSLRPRLLSLSSY